MAFLLGTRRGLDACSSDRATSSVPALDHGQASCRFAAS